MEDAARERQEILEAAEREIEYHRSIAAELETTMIEDFEWKLHEIEADYNRKLRDAAAAAAATNKAAPPSRKSSTMSLPPTGFAGGVQHKIFVSKLMKMSKCLKLYFWDFFALKYSAKIRT